MFINDWLERRRIRKSFSSYVSPGVVRLIEENPQKYFCEPEKKHVQFLLVQVDDRDTSAQINDLPKIVDILWKHSGTLGHILNVAFVYGFFGSPFPEADTVENRIGAVREMQETLGSHIRIAHGECIALIGNFGGERRVVWDALIPQFSVVLTQLLATPYGTAIEIPDPGKPETGNAKP
jgi:hypothetical protein